MRFIEDFIEDERVLDHYLCKEKRNLKTRTGKTYLSLKLQDKTGIIEAKVWDLNNSIQNFETNDFIKIEGTVHSYQNELQLTLTKIRKSDPGEYDEYDYIPATEKDINSLQKNIFDFIDSITNTYLNQLLVKIFKENPLITHEFLQHSAAKVMHHGYMGGLIEHTLSVVEICDFMSTRYKFVNRDLLISVAMLHDIGKIFELSDFPINDYTDDGQLLGHIILGIDLVSNTAREIENFPPELLSIVKHCIISHHGEYEYASPKKPKTIEAFILHCADNMDAKVKMFEEFIEKDNTQGNWVGYHKMLARNIRKSDYDEKL